MSDLPASNAKDTIPPLMGAYENDKFVAERLLREINSGLSAPTEQTGAVQLTHEYFEVDGIRNDTAGPGVINALENAIESNDPALGSLHATIERNEQGNIKSFVFQYPPTASAWNNDMNKLMTDGYTRNAAYRIEAGSLGVADTAYKSGTFTIPVSPDDY
jgi:hypothetical protein